MEAKDHTTEQAGEKRNYLKQAPPAAQPVFHAAEDTINMEFSPDDAESLLSVLSTATEQLAAVLGTSSRSSELTAEGRELIANGYRLVAGDRDHIQYVTSRQQELIRKAGLAYDQLTSAIVRDNSQTAAVDSYSMAVFQVRLAFDSLN